jgi:hypothetical protein
LQKYVRLFLKIKQEASGFPPEMQTEEEKDAFIEAYERVQGIHLDRDAIVHNPGLRLIAKLYLNRLVQDTLSYYQCLIFFR